MTTTHPALTLIEQRISANRFDATHTLADAEIERLVHLATRAPTAYNLQNWRFIAVRTPVGRAAPGNWPQKPRRPLAQVLEFA